MLTIFRRVLTAAILVTGVSLTLWSIWPAGRLADSVVLNPGEMQLPSSGLPSGLAVPGAHQVRLEWPTSLRIGDNAEVILWFEELPTGAPLSPGGDGFSDIYHSYSLMVKARLELVGLKIDPPGEILESMPRGAPVKLTWKISTRVAGSYPGDVWLYLQFLPLDGSPPIQKPVFVRQITIHASSFFGLDTLQAQLVGGGGIIMSFILVAKDMIKFIRSRLATMRGKPHSLINSAQNSERHTDV